MSRNLLVVLVFYVLPVLGFLLALVLLVDIMRQRRSPAATLAWLMAIVFIPYVGLPAYLVFGGRKTKHRVRGKAPLPTPVIEGPLSAHPERGTNDEAKNADMPLRSGNRVELLGTGEAAYNRLMEHVAASEKTIDVATFILGNDQTGAAIVEALAAKARSGVAVRLLFDDLGTFRPPGNALARLRDAGGRYASFMPMLHRPFRGRANLRNHRKMAIFDGRVAVVGGMNLAAEYMGKSESEGRWRDLSLEVSGPAIADFQTVFNSNWEFASGEHEETKGSSPQPEPSDGVLLQVVPSGPDVDGDPLHDAILDFIFAARRRLWLVTPYFVPDEMVTKALCIAARRGVDVRLVVPRSTDHPLADLVRRPFLREILRADAKVFKYLPAMLHGKLMLRDDDYAVVGSANLDMRSFFLNYEIALFIYSREVVQPLAAWVEEMFDRCESGQAEVTLPVEFVENIGRLFAPLL